LRAGLRAAAIEVIEPSRLFVRGSVA
jgi:hypothetical protein